MLDWFPLVDPPESMPHVGLVQHLNLHFEYLAAKYIIKEKKRLIFIFLQTRLKYLQRQTWSSIRFPTKATLVPKLPDPALSMSKGVGGDK